MSKPLDHIHHVAIQIEDIKQSVDWYTTQFYCEIAYHDSTRSVYIQDPSGNNVEILKLEE